MPIQRILFAGRTNDRHDQNAAGRWQQYYDQSTADLVFNMYAVDFRAFRYERFMERPLESEP